ncbi:hypothetical protein CLNEO_27270 [Anaerotignum neopropionicum]|uniref:YcxB-like protein domain-containing protein n=1 Tax=Anaerotignum neopropionicum TaxID=36847 RepID=A0A136WC13_9FIRM|nr:hypothetical protein [Anaerotignum neopropionicum]KXL51869.1 hypothetical protein CLNEO_27270 [Anaerotignum neopropionicum]
MNFIFSLTEYNSSLFQSQISVVLEKRNELYSRERFPKIWRYIDKKKAARMPQKALKRQRRRYRIYGFLLLIMGIYLFIPGLMDPKELFGPLIGGALVIVLGVGYIRYGKTSKKVRFTFFNKSAKKLFEGHRSLNFEKIRFEDNMICFSQEDGIKYEEIGCVFVTTDFFVFLWNDIVVVLQKKDLISSSEREFLDFLASKTQKSYEIISID